jgi:glycosyltransferase involved in cell wall biosynthesis
MSLKKSLQIMVTSFTVAALILVANIRGANASIQVGTLPLVGTDNNNPQDKLADVLAVIDAYNLAILQEEMKLVIAGDADHETEFSKAFKSKATDNSVVLPGFIKGADLDTIFTNCRLFIIPSFYEGLPLTLLEAMGYGLDILASNIPQNMQVKLPDESYFEVGDANDLSRKISDAISRPISKYKYDLSRYIWKSIARQTEDVYKSVIESKR